MSRDKGPQTSGNRRAEIIEELHTANTHQDSRKEHRLVLVGAGYAHLQVIRLLSAAKDQIGFSRITLIDVQQYANYRSMIPGFLSGFYESYQEASIDLEQICNQPGCTFVNDGVIDVDLQSKNVQLTEDATRIPYDVLSFDIGSIPKSLDDVPGAFEYAIPTRPIQELLSRLEGIETEIRQSPSLEKEELRMVIVGGDVSGVELAFSLVARWRPLLKDELQVTLVTPEESLATTARTRIGHEYIKEKAVEKGISVCFQEIVKEVDRNLLKFESGLQIPFTYCIWATGAACHDLARTLKDNGLAVSTEGWIEINNSLQSVSHPNVFAAGDCCQSISFDVPKSGVFSIQEGPVLARNLKLFNTSRKAASKDEPHHTSNLEQFHPDIHCGFQFLECGDGTAIGFASSGLVIHGKWVQAIKMAMDREFVCWFDGQQRPGWDSSRISIDDHVFSKVGSMMSPAEAAALLKFITVPNYRQAWWLLKHMALDPNYREAVLEEYAKAVEMPTEEHFGFEIMTESGSGEYDPRPKWNDQSSTGLATMPQASSCA